VAQAVREYNGTGHRTDCEVIDSTGALTVVAVVKRLVNGTWDGIATHQTSADAFRISLALTATNRLQLATHNGTAAFVGDSSGGAAPFTVLAADGWCLLVASLPAGATSNPTLSKFTPAGGWVHTTPVANMQKPASHATGKLRLGQYENSDDAAMRLASYAEWIGLAMNQTQVESLDGGDRQAWKTVAGGYNDLIEPAVTPAGVVAATWATLIASSNGLMDMTATAGAGTIVTGDNPAGTTYVLGVTAGGTAPANTVAPALSGTAQVGQTLTCSTGTWTGDATITYAYQWKRAGTNISGATASTYLVVPADVASALSCTVTASNGAGSSSANSNSMTPAALDTFIRVSGAWLPRTRKVRVGGAWV